MHGVGVQKKRAACVRAYLSRYRNAWYNTAHQLYIIRILLIDAIMYPLFIYGINHSSNV